MATGNKDVAVDAMIEGLRRARVRLVEGEGPHAGEPLGPHSFRQVLGEVLMVGSVHLHAPEEDLAGEPLAEPPPRDLDGQWLAHQFAKVDAHLSKLGELIQERGEEVDEEAIFEHGREMGRAEALARQVAGSQDDRVDAAYQRGYNAGLASEMYPAHWDFAQIEAERRHRERMATIHAETEARVLAQSVCYPPDYEVWRDALSLAVDRGRNQLTREELLDLAAWFWERLQETPVQLHDDGALLAHEDAIADDDEDDCPNCGSDDDEHEEDCPRQES